MVDSMNPILFSENSTTWNTNGLGRLSDAISCKVKEQRNGEYELELTYPTSGKHFSDISIRKIIAAIPSQGSTLQPFRIYRITRPIRGKVTVKARHISYDLSKYVCTPFSVAASSSACASVLSNLKSRSVKSCPFSFWTDVTTVASYSQMTPASIRQRLGGIEGSVLDQFGGEYEWDGLTVKLHRQRGTVTNYTLRYGKNITDVNQDENIAETATGVVPFWSDVDGTTVITGDVIEKQDISYSSPLIIPLDLSSEWQTAPTVAQLNTAATVYVNKSDFGIPKVSVDVSFVNLADTEEYKDILPMQSLHLCDTVKVQFEELGIDTTAKVVETVYDVLAERYESIQIGSLKSSLAGLITDYEASMAQTVSDTGKRVFAEANTEAQDLINNATAWLTASGGYVIAVKNNDGSWKELLFLDTNNVQTAHNVLRINQNGIGFSSNGVGGPYTQAWTLDGRLVVGGTNVPSITCYDSNNNILFQASANGVQVNKGDIILRDTNNNIVFQASSGGMLWNSEKSKMLLDGTIVTEGKIRVAGIDHTLRSEMANGGIVYYRDGLESFSISASHFGRGGTIESSNFVSIKSASTDIHGPDGITLSTEPYEFDDPSQWDEYSYLEIDRNFAVFKVRSGDQGTGDFFITVDGDIYIYDGSMNKEGYTGTKNGLTFIKGICIGPT